MSRIKKVLAAVGVIALLGTGTAVAANTIDSHDIINGSVMPRDLNDRVLGKYITFTTVNDGSKVVDRKTLMLSGNATSIESDQGVPFRVKAGQVISFNVTMQGTATCVGGAPRMYVKIGDQESNSFDADNSTHGCPGDNAPPSNTDGKVHFVVPNSGQINALFFVYDNGAGGTVYVDDMQINGQPVRFRVAN